MPEQPKPVFGAISETERRRLVMQENCGYDHSGSICRRCGFHNAEAARAIRYEACVKAYGVNEKCEAGDSLAFTEGFEAGYAYANDLLKSFYDLGGVKLP
jgi:hypothetical protein